MSRLAVLLLFLLAACQVSAAERIHEYRSEIAVYPDASMIVTETIVVQAAGRLIQRGIYRDFPTDYTDRFGNRYRVGFEVLAVTRNGAPEPWHTERRSNGVRVYVGSRDRRIPAGRHEYTIRYRTDRQLGYFEAHDELYWNVTGNGWDLPIDAASAEIRLPASVPTSEITLEAWTGPYGSAEQSYRAGVSGGWAHIESTRRLGPREGLTIVVGWPKGHVHEPGRTERIGFMLRDNLGVLLAGLGLALVLAYLGWAWIRHGIDPPRGVIFPHYEPPGRYSPASTRFIMRMGYDNRAFAAAILSLAVKGHLVIDLFGDKYSVHKRQSDRELAPGERVLLRELFSQDERVQLDNSNHALLSKAKRAHQRSLKRDYERIYFLTNSIWLLPSLASTLVLGLAIILLEAMTPLAAGLLALALLAHVLFYWLLRAPTERGRRLMDKLEGFRKYLEVAEKDELNLRNPPEKTPELFERYLPFALALGVEQKWAERFAGVFARLSAEQSSRYQPVWFHGHFNPSRLDSFTQGVGKSLTTAISSASTPPGSSSGSGGGGFSGGGGGGGGGGGW